MLLFRSLALGLLGSVVLLLATRKDTLVVQMTAPTHSVTEAPTIIDAAPGLSPNQLAQLIRLRPDEHVTSIDDQPVESTLDAGSKIAALDGRRFLDLTIKTGRDHGERRVLVLVH